MPPSVHPVDEILPPPKLSERGLRRVLVTNAKAVAAPLNAFFNRLSREPAKVDALLAALAAEHI
jgi:hypothetical protein